MAAYVDHIVAQIEQNVQFLVEQGHMTQQDAQIVLQRLPSSAAPAPVQSIARGVSNLSVNGRRGPPAPVRAASLSSGVPQAKAVWAYNENGSDPDDLSFRPGDIIEVTEETNADWWTGRFNGKQGLFPSNHVEKIPSSASVLAAPAAPRRTVLAPPPSYDSTPPQAGAGGKKPYKAFGAAYHGMDQPPPAPSAGPVNSVGLQQADQSKEKSKFGKLGNTMANSAAGGVGFGAGAAIGGGLVRAIF